MNLTSAIQTDADSEQADQVTPRSSARAASDPSTVDQDTAGLLASAPRREIVALLDNLPTVPSAEEPHTREKGLTAAHLAQRLGRHVTTIRFHLDQLVAGGLVDYHDERGRVGRPSRYYTLAQRGMGRSDPSDAYRVTARLLLDMLTTGSDPDVTAAAWMGPRAGDLLTAPAERFPATTPGQWLGKVGVVIDLMQRWGFSPTISSADAGHTTEMTMGLCPIGELTSSSSWCRLRTAPRTHPGGPSVPGRIRCLRSPATPPWRKFLPGHPDHRRQLPRL